MTIKTEELAERVTPNYLPEHRSDELQPCSECCNGQESMGQFKGCVTALQGSGYIRGFGLLRQLNRVKYVDCAMVEAKCRTFC